MLIVIAAALVLAAPCSSASLEVLKKRESRQLRSLHRWEGALTFFRNHPRQARSFVGRIEVHRAKVWVRVILAELADNRAEQKAKQPVGHGAGWSCITNGAYPGAPHEGNGYNGAYVGPLGMTTPWAGHYPTGRDWVHTPVATVYAIAEREAARHGWAYSWMRGQWPNTFPPCAGFFV